MGVVLHEDTPSVMRYAAHATFPVLRMEKDDVNNDKRSIRAGDIPE